MLLGAGRLTASEVTAARVAKGILEYEDKAEHEAVDVPVQSEAISSVGWRPDGTITVTFHRGGTYTYSSDYETFQAFVSAPSVGRFFNDHFR